MDASYAVTAFHGGEWSENVQGRFDDPKYKSGLNACLNAIPLEEGSWTRRPGTRFRGFSRRGSVGRLYNYAFNALLPYDMEFTPGHLRFWNGLNLVLDAAPVAVVSISNANPAVLTTSIPVSWVTGDSVQIFLTPGNSNTLAMAYLQNRQFVVTGSGSSFTLADQFGNTLDGSQFSLGTTAATVGRILDLAAPWATSAQISQLQFAQSEQQMLAFCPGVTTQLITATFGVSGYTGTGAQIYGFALANAPFVDGPYLDPPTDHSTVQSSGTSGSVTLTFSTSQNFTAAHVGRNIRLFSEPAAFVLNAHYVSGDNVKYNGAYYQAINSSFNAQHTPDVVPQNWTLNPSGAQWAYAVITGVTDSSTVTATLHNIPNPPGPQIVLPVVGPLLYTHDSSDPIQTYQLGLYWGTSWPTCGSFHKGRFWFAGSVANRADSGMANNGLVCSPTCYDGTIADDNGLSLIFNFPDVMQIQWMHPNHLGIVCGCVSGEVLIRASQLGDPITPTSVDAEQVTFYGCANVAPTLVGYSLLLVQRYARKVLDFAASIFTGRHSAYNLSYTAKHLTSGNVQEIRYQRERAPVLWCRTGATNAAAQQQLVGVTYKREDSYQLQGPQIAGWHRHILGDNRVVESITTGPNDSGSVDSLSLMTNYPAGGHRHVCVLTDIFDEGQSNLCAWFLDDAISPVSSSLASDNSSVTFYGFWHGIGNTITAFIGGLDCGDYVVQSNGSITVPFSPANTFQPLFTLAYLQSLSGTACNQIGVTQTIPATSPAFLTQPSVQSYVDQPLGVTHSEWSSAAVPGQATIYGTGPADAQTYLSRFTFSSGAFIDEQNINSPWAISPVFQANFVQAPSGHVWVPGAGSTYAIAEIIPGTPWTLGQTFGTQTGSYPANIDEVQNAVWLTVGANSYILSASFFSGSVSAYLTNPGALGGASSRFASLGANNNICAGPQNASSATAYWTSKPISIFGADYSLYSTVIDASAITYVGGWPTQNPGINSTLIKSYVPTDFDASWGAFVSFSGPAYDATDGNVIVYVTGSGGGNPQYLAKLSVTTGAVLWKTPLAGTIGISDQSITNARIQTGTFFVWAQTATFAGTAYAIKTADGTVTSHAYTGITQIANQVSDDVLGSIMGDIGWDTANGTLTLLNATASSGGTMGAVYFATPGTATSYNTILTPGLIGFTYNSDGQLLRPQEPVEVGTQNGPALGKTRRFHNYAVQLVSAITGSLSIGTDFSKLYPAKFTSTKRPGQGTPLTVLQPYTDIWWDALKDDYSFDGMLAWRISRPYPCTIVAVELFGQGQDR